MTKRPTGRRPKEGIIEQYARWYVQHRVSGISKNKLAQAYHETHAHPASDKMGHTWMHDRKTVSDGIKEIDRLLKLTH